MQATTLKSLTTKHRGIFAPRASAAAQLVFAGAMLLVSLAVAPAMPAHAQRFLPEFFQALLSVPSTEPNQPDGGTGSDIGNFGEGGTIQTPLVGDLHPSFAIDPGGHIAMVRGVTFLSGGKRIMSAGFDKTVRIWDIAQGTTVQRIVDQTWPSPMGGSIYAIAVTPDEHRLAVAGQMCARGSDPSCGDIRIFDVRTGVRLRVLSAQEPGHVFALSASPNNKLLASALVSASGSPNSANSALTVWRLADGMPVARLANPGGGQPYTKVAFLADGDHIAASSDTDAIHVFKIGTSEPVATLHAHEPLSTVAASADGKLIAAGSVSGAIRVWNWPDRSVLRDLEGNGDRVSVLAFDRSASAESLAAATAGRPFIVRILNARTGATITAYEGHENAVSALAFSADGTRVASADVSGHAIHIWSAVNAKLEQTLGGRTATPYSVGFIRESGTNGETIERIAWGFADPCPDDDSCPETPGVLQFSMRIPGPSGGIISPPEPWLPEVIGARRPSTPPDIDITRAVLEANQNRFFRMSLDDPKRFPLLSVGRDDGPRIPPIVRGKDRGADHISYSFSPDGKMFASGSRNGTLETFTLDGTPANRLLGHTGDIWGLAYSSDGRLLITGSSDQTVRLWNATTGEQIVSLVQLPTNGEWVMWTPQGYFAASPEGERIVSAVIQRGEGKPQEVVMPRQVSEYLYRPEIVRRAIEMASAEAAVTWGRAQGIITDFTLENLRSVPIGRFKIVEPSSGTTTSDGKIKVTIARTSEGSEGSTYTIYVNGNKVDVAQSDSTLGDIPTVSFEVPLHNGTNKIKIAGVMPNRLMSEDTVEVVQTGSGLLDPGTLYIVAIGIDRYEELTDCRPDGCDLLFAGKDAQTFAKLVAQRMGSEFKNGVKKKVLFNGAGGDLEPTANNINNALLLFRKAKQNDTSVLFVAGHGTNRDSQRGYLLLATDAMFDGTTYTNSIDWVGLQQAIQSPKGRKIVFMDTCRSSSAYGLYSQINTAVRNQISLYLASKDTEDAIEAAHYGDGHGAFTYALRLGLEFGEADEHPHDKRIMATELDRYTRRKVLELTGERQKPYYWYSLGVEDFELIRLP